MRRVSASFVIPPRSTSLTSLTSLVVVAASLATVTSSDAAPGADDPAARGLDVFIHAPDRAAARGLLPVQIEAVGFPSVVVMKPLPGVTIEAAWDPEHLGPNVSAAPAPVRAVTDGAGRVHLDVPVPPGEEQDLVLLVGVRSGDHQRTRAVKVKRVRPHEVKLHIPDRRVVPGSALSSWIMVQSATTGEPVPMAPVTLQLLEGGLARFTARVTTDLAGTAMVRVPIPPTEEPWWSWDLQATTGGADGSDGGVAHVTLVPREETPGLPRLMASWASAEIRTGDRVAFTVRIRDATGAPIASLPVRTWIGPKGTQPPEEQKEWEKASALVATNARGEVEGTATAPTTITPAGTTMHLVARTHVDGHDLNAEATVAIGIPSAEAELLPEASSIVPGIEQHMLLRVRDAQTRPVSASFQVEGDGLRARVTTDKFGEADVTWAAPRDLGALRAVGPCAGGVAAAVIVRPEGEVAALASRRAPFELCVKVDREAAALVRTDTPLGRAGDRTRVRVIAAPALAPDKRLWSVLLRSPDGAQAAGAWVEDGPEGAEIQLPPGATGRWSIAAVAPGRERKSRAAAGVLLAIPAMLPKLAARIAGGRAAPGGTIEVEAELSDGHGRGLPGTVSAVMIDLHGGGSLGGLDRLDTRKRLCGLIDTVEERCDALIEGDPTLEGARRGLLGAHLGSPLEAASDPGEASAQFTQAFRDVVRSLEGAVYEAAESADRLRDARRKGPRGWSFNPELMTLVTAAMSPEPRTPGGESLVLADLVALDPQVSFDNVARRVTRLKLFRVLAEVRAFRREKLLDADEPALRDPNALLRRLVRDERILASLLLDPWGGTMEFTKTGSSTLPFLSVVRGFELRAPGPDGRLGTGDDVRDPFARVLRSGTSYADAVQEDRIVDAKFDMEVGDATVTAWQSLLEELTGTALGGSGIHMGASGVGERGVGHGAGTGVGQGFGRLSTGVPTGVAFWSAPVRTDADGRARINVPLGDIETTWRLALVGVPDRARPAVATLDVPVALPLSTRVDSGASWIEGDSVDVVATVRNRTAKPVSATLTFSAAGAAILVDPKEVRIAGRASKETEGSPRRPASSERRVEIPAEGSSRVVLRLTAPKAGEASLQVITRAAGLPDDVMRHIWEVKAAGEPTDTVHVQWVEGEADFGPWLDRRPHRPMAPARLILERGAEKALDAALESVDPDRGGSPDAMAIAVEVAGRIRRWAIGRGGDADPTAKRAAIIGRRAIGRMVAYRSHEKTAVTWTALRRADAWQDLEIPGINRLAARGSCPAVPADVAELEGLEVEPAPAGGVQLACWDTFVSEMVTDARQRRDPVALAQVVLALADRPHRAALAAATADRLREIVAPRPSGAITLSAATAQDRAARATVYAGLLRAASLGKPDVALAPRLAAWLLVQRDMRGGYGSPAATRAAVQALLASPITAPGVATVTMVTDGVRQEIEVGPSASRVIPIAAKAQNLKLDARGAGVFARLERPVIRLWALPPDQSASPVHLDVAWPKARAGEKAVLRVSARHDRQDPTAVDIRLPLPPGVSLAAPMKGVQQLRGVLAMQRILDVSARADVFEIPLRFSLAGQITVPEGTARLTEEYAPRAVTPARPLKIE